MSRTGQRCRRSWSGGYAAWRSKSSTRHDQVWLLHRLSTHTLQHIRWLIPVKTRFCTPTLPAVTCCASAHTPRTPLNSHRCTLAGCLPRPNPAAGKKCLVLDIDYTLFDLNSSAEHPDELARPYLHEFLTACYEHYDIIIWSATNMKWVEVRSRQPHSETRARAPSTMEDMTPGSGVHFCVCGLLQQAGSCCHSQETGSTGCQPHTHLTS